jgi:hypothetical protein
MKKSLDEDDRPRNRNRHAKELWENKDFRLKVEVPKTKKRRKLRTIDILNLDEEALEDFE